MSIFCNWAFFPPLFFPFSSVLSLCFYAFTNSHLAFGGDFTPITFGDHIGDPVVNLRIVRANLTHFYSSFGYTHKTEDKSDWSRVKTRLSVTYRAQALPVLTNSAPVNGPKHTSKSTSRWFWSGPVKVRTKWDLQGPLCRQLLQLGGVKTTLQRRVGQNSSTATWKSHNHPSWRLDCSYCRRGWHNQLLGSGGN